MTDQLRATGVDAVDIAASRAAQEMSAADRPPPSSDRAPEPEGDGPRVAVTINSPPKSIDAPEPPRSDVRFDGPVVSQGDDRRAAIQARFRDKRVNDVAELEHERETILAAQRGELPPDDAAAMQDVLHQGPQHIKLKIRGQDVEFTTDQLIALAQKGAAGDSYLAESRSILDQAKAEAQRIVNAAHQAQQRAPFNDQQFDELYSALVYEDEEGGKAKLRDAVRSLAVQHVQQQQQQVQAQRNQAEFEKGQRELAAFQAENPALAQDEFAMTMMGERMFSLFAADLQAAGVDLSQLKSKEAIANTHLSMRAAGLPVRSVKDVMNTARNEYVAWRNGGPAPPNPEPPAPPAALRQGPARIAVNINRDARRAMIPAQPPRAATPMRRVPEETPVDRTTQETRSAAAQKMIAQRRRARGMAG
jgi:hypothetical protein